MANARAIVKRRKAVQNIRKITRTMQLIATARFQRAFNRALASKPYTQKITELVSQLAANAGQIDHPLLRVNKPVGCSALLVLTSNRGLCGGYNGNLLRTANAFIHRNEQPGPETETTPPGRKILLHVVGKKGISSFRFQRREMAATYTDFDDRPRFVDVEPIADEFIRQYSEGELDSVHVVHMRFESTLFQIPETLQLLPIPAIKPAEEDATAESLEYEFSPPPAELLAELLPLTVKARLFQCFTDAAVSEQVARMVAMKAATDAGGEMIRQLTQAYNRARQSQITLDLLDIVGGAEALA